jgi:GNAT superfamily N-acetyltransferase
MNDEPSRIYLFERARELEKSYPGDKMTGVWGISTFRVLKGWGNPTETEWPYPQRDDPWPPTEPANIDKLAKRSRIAAYHRVRSVDECRKLLAADRPVSASFGIDDTWTNPQAGRLCLPRDAATASHSICLVGYRDDTRCFIFANSWGDQWGDHGYGYLPNAYFDDRFLEGWTSAIPTPDFPKIAGGRGLMERGWAVPDILGDHLHVVELIDRGNDEILGWTITTRREEFLDVEDLFVRPRWRLQGLGSALATHIREQSDRLRIPVRMWISHPDASIDEAGIAVLRRLGLQRRPSPVRWASAVALPR